MYQAKCFTVSWFVILYLFLTDLMLSADFKVSQLLLSWRKKLIMKWLRSDHVMLYWWLPQKI